MLIFFSPRQKFYFKTTEMIVCDGNYKFKPVGSHEVYRVFGFVKKIHSMLQIAAFPKQKDKKTFKKMWENSIAKAFDEPIKLKITLFDHEFNAHDTFKKRFPGVDIKMCSLHVKQNVNKQVQEKRLPVEYQDDRNVQDVVRMLGALQLSPPEVWPHTLMLIHQRIQDRFNLVVNRLNELVEFFFVSNFFCE
uniref:MULE transposase domain-containing protein n=1 Tax=Ditylenchus dipsaci TaxID=166011 RepID=A0A915DD51_9BILA